MLALRKLLDTYRKEALDERGKGDSFERLIKFYLENDKEQRFVKVWTRKEWAKLNELDGQDTGIDLVGQDEDGVICAIQCKFYKEGSKLYRSHVDSFFAASGKSLYGRRLIVHTTGEISNHVSSVMEGQQQYCNTLTLSHLEESAIDWGAYAPGKKAVFKPKKKLRPHQKEALRKVTLRRAGVHRSGLHRSGLWVLRPECVNGAPGRTGLHRGRVLTSRE